MLRKKDEEKTGKKETGEITEKATDDAVKDFGGMKVEATKSITIEDVLKKGRR